MALHLVIRRERTYLLPKRRRKSHHWGGFVSCLICAADAEGTLTGSLAQRASCSISTNLNSSRGYRRINEKRILFSSLCSRRRSCWAILSSYLPFPDCKVPRANNETYVSSRTVPKRILIIWASCQKVRFWHRVEDELRRRRSPHDDFDRSDTWPFRLRLEETREFF